MPPYIAHLILLESADEREIALLKPSGFTVNYYRLADWESNEPIESDGHEKNAVFELRRVPLAALDDLKKICRRDNRQSGGYHPC